MSAPSTLPPAALSGSIVADRTGLIGHDHPIPLLGVDVDARIEGRCAHVRAVQRYKNTESIPIEATYVFPLEEGAAVCGFEAKVGDRVITGKVEARDRAFDDYDDAIAEGHGAFLMEQQRPGVFTVSIGNLMPGQDVEIALSYVSLLPHQGQAVRFALPAAVAPRRAAATHPIPPPEAPVRLADEVPYRLHLAVRLRNDPPLRAVESPSHPTRIEVDDDTLTVTVSSPDAAMDRDFVLLFEPADPHTPQVHVARDSEGQAIIGVTIYPDPSNLPGPGMEIVYLVDTAPEMTGDALTMARRACLASLETLTERDSFNIVSPGPSPRALWPVPHLWKDTLSDTSRRFVGGLVPESKDGLVAALQSLLVEPPASGRPRQVAIFSNGLGKDTAALVGICRRLGARDRIFVFGVGPSTDAHLLRSMARAGGGAVEMLHPGERLGPAVWRMSGRMGAPVIRDASLDWEGLDVEQAPAVCPPVFGGDSLTIFGRVRGGLSGAVTLRADGRQWRAPVDLTRDVSDSPIPLFWARERIREMEARLGRRRGSHRETYDARLDALIALSRRYNLLSQATGFVAVEERAPAAQAILQSELRRVPIKAARDILSEALPEAPVLHRTPATVDLTLGEVFKATVERPPVEAASVPDLLSTGDVVSYAGGGGVPDTEGESLELARTATQDAPAPRAAGGYDPFRPQKARKIAPKRKEASTEVDDGPRIFDALPSDASSPAIIASPELKAESLDLADDDDFDGLEATSNEFVPIPLDAAKRKKAPAPRARATTALAERESLPVPAPESRAAPDMPLPQSMSRESTVDAGAQAMPAAEKSRGSGLWVGAALLVLLLIAIAAAIGFGLWFYYG